jgi:2-polyprenyl-3-methyl-5-hydroxy-6-metoxy-1,4-benzoquinol methylase
MRLSLRSGNIIEWLALRVGLVPTPAAEAWAGMALSGVLVAATRLGVTARLAAAPATAEELADDLNLDPTATRLLLNCLQSIGHVSRRADRYQLSRRSRRWLDPDSDLSVARFVDSVDDYWAWWSALSEVIRAGQSVRHHHASSEDSYWRRYVTGQFELARLSVSEVARSLELPDGSRTLLDIGGAHGLYSAELCRRHPQLVATVFDLPGSARIGREIVVEEGMTDRVSHTEGNALTDDLDGPYDVVLLFNLVHHLDPQQIVGLFGKIHAALSPGGLLAVMDALASPSGSRSAAADFLGMFVYLSSGAQSYTAAQLHGWLDVTGFEKPRTTPIRRIPGQSLYQATVRRN